MPVNRDVLLNGRYLIMSLLGEGAMGAVYRAMDSLPDPARPVVVKEIRLGGLPTASQIKVSKQAPRGDAAVHEDLPQGVDVPTDAVKMEATKKSSTFTREKAAEQFKKEAKLLFGLSHPNLPKVLDYFEVGDDRYLVMELIEGEDLDLMLEKNGNKPILIPQALDWILQVAAALNYCHSKGITHRDVKPSNIIVTAEGKACLVDFGIARMADSDTTTMVRGKTRSLSPIEQYGSHSLIDARGDVYALGSTLYALLTGQAPEDALERTAGVTLVPLRELNPLVSKDLESVTLQAIALKQENRFQSISAFISALKNAAPFEPSKHAPTQPVVTVGAGQPAARPQGLPKPAFGKLARQPVVPSAWAPTTAVATEKKPFRKWALALSIGGPLLIALTVLGIIFGPRLFKGKPLEYPLREGIGLPALTQVISKENVTRIIEIARWGKGVLRDAAYTADGKTLVVATATDIIVYRAEDLTEQNVINTRLDLVTIAVSPDGEMIVGAPYDEEQLFFWDLASGEQLGILEMPESIRALTFSPDGSQLVAGGYEGSVIFVEPDKRAIKSTMTAHTDWVEAVVFSPDGQLLASASDDNTVILWDSIDGRILETLEGHADYVMDVAFSPDGETLASTSWDGSIILWDVTDGYRIDQFYPEGNARLNVVFTADGSRLVASGWTVIDVWDVQTGEVVDSIPDLEEDISQILFNPERSELLVLPDGATIRFFNSTDWSRTRDLAGFSVVPFDVAISADGRAIAVGQIDDNVALWDVTRGTRTILKGHSDWVRGVAFSPDGGLMASASDDGTVRTWDVASASLQNTFEVTSDYLLSVAFSPDGQKMAIGSADSMVYVIYASNGSYLNTLASHSDWVRSVAYSPPDRHWIASSSDDSTVVIWDAITGDVEQILTGHSDWVRDVTFSPDGSLIASVSDDGTVILWDTSSWSVNETLEGPGDYIRCVAFSPDGSLVAAGVDDYTVRIWNVETGEQLTSLAGNTELISGIAFSADGTMLITSSHDGTIRIWGIKP